MSKKVIITLIIFIIAVAIFFYKDQLSSKAVSQPSVQKSPSTTDKPQIISTNPNPLDEAIVPASQVIEITFNKPLQNSGEFKVRIEPSLEFKIELSSDRKTAKIIPTKPLELGFTYTMTIGAETKFDGIGRWGEEKTFHFKTIKYRGI